MYIVQTLFTYLTLNKFTLGKTLKDCKVTNLWSSLNFNNLS